MQAERSIKKQTLKYIDQSVIAAGEFLHEYTSDKKRGECLKAFVECPKIVEWIRKETGGKLSVQWQRLCIIIITIKQHQHSQSPFIGIHELKNFVAIALGTASVGEDDLTRDKLTNLEGIGSGFSALIYLKRPDVDFKELMRRCRSLWGTWSKMPTLPEMMVC